MTIFSLRDVTKTAQSCILLVCSCLWLVGSGTVTSAQSGDSTSTTGAPGSSNGTIDATHQVLTGQSPAGAKAGSSGAAGKKTPNQAGISNPTTNKQNGAKGADPKSGQTDPAAKSDPPSAPTQTNKVDAATAKRAADEIKARTKLQQALVAYVQRDGEARLSAASVHDHETQILNLTDQIEAAKKQAKNVPKEQKAEMDKQIEAKRVELQQIKDEKEKLKEKADKSYDLLKAAITQLYSAKQAAYKLGVGTEVTPPTSPIRPTNTTVVRATVPPNKPPTNPPSDPNPWRGSIILAAGGVGAGGVLLGIGGTWLVDYGLKRRRSKQAPETVIATDTDKTTDQKKTFWIRDHDKCVAYRKRIDQLCMRSNQGDVTQKEIQDTLYTLWGEIRKDEETPLATVVETAYNKLCAIKGSNQEPLKRKQRDAIRAILVPLYEEARTLIQNAPSYNQVNPETTSTVPINQGDSPEVIALKQQLTTTTSHLKETRSHLTTTTSQLEQKGRELDALARARDALQTQKETLEGNITLMKDSHKTALGQKDSAISDWIRKHGAAAKEARDWTEAYAQLTDREVIGKMLAQKLPTLPATLGDFVKPLLEVATQIERRNVTALTANLERLDHFVYRLPPAFGLLAAEGRGAELKLDDLLRVISFQQAIHKRLEELGLFILQPTPGETFNKEQHTTTDQDQIWIQEKSRHNTVASVKRIGYTLNGKVLRKAEVKRNLYNDGRSLPSASNGDQTAADERATSNPGAAFATSAVAAPSVIAALGVTPKPEREPEPVAVRDAAASADKPESPLDDQVNAVDTRRLPSADAPVDAQATLVESPPYAPVAGKTEPQVEAEVAAGLVSSSQTTPETALETKPETKTEETVTEETSPLADPSDPARSAVSDDGKPFDFDALLDRAARPRDRNAGKTGG